MKTKKRTRQEKARTQAKRQQMLSADTPGVQTAQIQQAVGYSFKAGELGMKSAGQAGTNGAVSKTGAASKTEMTKSQPRRDYVHELFAYDVRLIYRDLIKTILLTIAIFFILGGIAWYLK